MYESINPSVVIACLDGVISHLRGQGYVGITVETGRTLCGWPARHRGVRPGRTRHWPLHDVRHAVHFALSHTYATVGDQCWQQRGGVPIGGLVSDLAAALVLGAAEMTWNADLRRAEQLRLATWRDDSLVPLKAQLRYVDDVIHCSRHVCSADST